MRPLACLAFLFLTVGAAPESMEVDEYPTSEGEEDISTQYIAMFKRGTSVLVRDRVLQLISDEDNHVEFDGIFLGFAKVLSDPQLDLVRRHPDIEVVEEDQETFAFGFVDQQGMPWGLGRISHREPGAEMYVYDETAGNGTCAYVVDTGVDDTHPDFGGRAKQIRSFVAESRIDRDGHGTHVAGIIGSATYGVAKQTLIYGVKVLDKASGGSLVDLLRGLEFVLIDHRMRDCPKGIVVNLSVGAVQTDLLDVAAAALVTSGIFVGVAGHTVTSDEIEYSPAFEPSVCVVGGSAEGDKLLHMREKGDRRLLNASWGPRIDVFAPGRGILSTWIGGSEASMTGTSQACPHVVGMAAYLASLEGLKGTGALCNRIRELSTKNALHGLPPETPNRLAYNGAGAQGQDTFTAAQDAVSSTKPLDYWEWTEEDRRKSCTRFDRLRLYFELAADSWAGTRNTIETAFPGPGRASHIIKEAPEPGFHEWQDINMNEVFGSSTVEFSEVKQIELISTSASRGSGRQNSVDSWKVTSMRLKARCAGSDIWLSNDKFASLDKVFNPWNGISYVLWKGSVAVNDWAAKPPCSHLKRLRVTLTISDKFWAGTDNDLYLDVGAASLLLASAPDRDETFTLDVPLERAFGSSAVVIERVNRIAVQNRGGNDDVLPQKMTIRGVCYGIPDISLKFSQETSSWVAGGEEWAVDIAPEQWEEVSHRLAT